MLEIKKMELKDEELREKKELMKKIKTYEENMVIQPKIFDPSSKK